jgi:DNA/RNA-binding domain of Phe-tRNA-synthetase-like protein
MSEDPPPREGAVDPELAAELPGLRLRTVTVPGGHGRTPEGVKLRLRELSTRFTGAQAVALRRRPVPHAYRVLFRQIGLDPDADRPPAEQAAVDRLVRGRFHAGERVADALLLALAETGVPVLALDAGAVRGELELRTAQTGETLPAGDYAHDLPAGRLVLADEAGPVAVLFGRVSTRHEPSRATTALLLAAVQAPGVPDVHVDEALWLAAEAIREP